MQTAVEWLVEQIKKDHYQKALSDNEWTEVIETAMAMEKEQITNAHLTGLIHPLEMEATKQAEQYYTETYGNHEN